jgi:peptidoglycan/LPS O-acetylase OafA/YrhL
MSAVLSLYLDAARFLAAFTVFLSHVSGQRLTGGLLWQFGPYGSQAVTVFFVLSGFVIAHVTARRGSTGWDYAVARAARIYSVALPALLLTFVLDRIGSAVNPDLYAAWWGYVAEGKFWQYLAAVTFTGRIWWLDVSVGSNLPYWSLHYEVWYYLIFGLALFAPPRWRVPATLIAMACAGPQILILMPLWLLGVAAYWVCQRASPGRTVGAVLASTTCLGWIAYEVAVHTLGRPVNPAWTFRPEIIQDYIVATLFAAHIVGVHALASGLQAAPRRLEAPIRWAAGATFTLYLLHLPVAQFLASINPWAAGSMPGRLLVVGGTLVAVFLVAAVTERRKDDWRNAIESLTRRVRPVRMA